MSSINPVILYPESLAKHAEQSAEKLAASITLGMGQFCTNPGLILAVEGEGLDIFIQSLAKRIATSAPQLMLSEHTGANYVKAIDTVKSFSEVNFVADAITDFPDKKERAVLAKVNADIFINHPHLQEEIFGPYSLIVVCKHKEALKTVLKSLGGQLTSTLMATENDMQNHPDILQIQQTIAGRILVNDVPTGVEVCSSMVHGGPFPATSDVRFTSVGTTSIKRWVRPVCYQGFPNRFLPDELKDENPLKIWRLVNDNWTKN
jgi:NADP-dependent aldehyde dehydrogenase